MRSAAVFGACSRWRMHPDGDPLRKVPWLAASTIRAVNLQTSRRRPMNLKTTLAAFAIAIAVAAPVSAQNPTLYKRVGGYDALAAVTDDFLARLVADQQFTKFFVGHSTDSIKRIRQLIVDELCAATG